MTALHDACVSGLLKDPVFKVISSKKESAEVMKKTKSAVRKSLGSSQNLLYVCQSQEILLLALE
jgi:hypothetical protein